jgi:hypothetical protein
MANHDRLASDGWAKRIRWRLAEPDTVFTEEAALSLVGQRPVLHMPDGTSRQVRITSAVAQVDGSVDVVMVEE